MLFTGRRHFRHI